MLRICSKCRSQLPADAAHFNRDRRSCDGFRSICRGCRPNARREQSREHRRTYVRKLACTRPEYLLWKSAKRRATERGLRFDIDVAHVVIPERCPILGVRLVITAGTGRHQRNTATLDRIKPQLGYVPGNVAVISWRANRIKHNATLEEILALANWMQSHLTEARSGGLGA